MSSTSVGFIGAGRIVSVILGGWKRVGFRPSRVMLFDPNAGVVDKCRRAFPDAEVVGSAVEAAGADVVFLAVHPPVIREVAEAIGGELSSSSILVSLAPKFTIEKLSGFLGGFKRIARVIPNAPSLVGRGYNPVAFGVELTAADRRVLGEAFVPLGEFVRVEEGDLEAYAILAAMGPTYFWPQVYALKALGEGFGLTEDATMRILDKMLWGAVATVKESGLTAEQVQDLIPVRPMAEEVAALSAAYGVRLTGLMDKIRP